jgi:hypothetical protein
MLLGCSYFYWLFQEYRAVRYEINIVKKIEILKMIFLINNNNNVNNVNIF